MAVNEDLSAYSTTAANNTPAGSDTVGPDLDNHLRDIKKNIRTTAENAQGGTQPPGFKGRLWADDSASGSSRITLRFHVGGDFVNLFDVDGSASNIESMNLAQSSIARDRIDLGDQGFVSTSRDLSAGTGLTGGGTLSADRFFRIDVQQLDPVSAVTADTIIISDASNSSAERKATIGSILDLAGGGTYEVVETLTASNSTSLDFTDVRYFDGTYRRVLAVITNLKLATDNVDLFFRFSEDSGASFVSASRYHWNVVGRSVSTDGNSGVTTREGQIKLNGDSINVGNGNEHERLYGLLEVNPSNIEGSGANNLIGPLVGWTIRFGDAGDATTRGIAQMDGGGAYLTLSANPTAFQMIPSSGNMSSGTVMVVGERPQ